MQRSELTEYIFTTYGVQPDYPWDRYPNYAVFRHSSNRKWFAIIMDVPKAKLGLPGGGMFDIVNLKCDPIMLGSFRAEPGIYPAYHLSKASWLSVALDGSAEDDKIKLLLDISYAMTAPKPKKQGKPRSKTAAASARKGKPKPKV